MRMIRNTVSGASSEICSYVEAYSKHAAGAGTLSPTSANIKSLVRGPASSPLKFVAS